MDITSHDLSLPDWGPYSDTYMGTSHISDVNNGFRFDLCVAPSIFKRKRYVPFARKECSYHPWEASADLSYYSYRHELEWKDRLYCDISYSLLDENSVLVRMECVNNTDHIKPVSYHLMASLNFPDHLWSSYKLPKPSAWVDAVEYVEIYSDLERPGDNLVPNGGIRREISRNQVVRGRVLRGLKGDRFLYRANLSEDLDDAVVIIRCRCLNEALISFCLADGKKYKLEIEPSSKMQLVQLYLGKLKAPELFFSINILNTSNLEIDGFVFCQANFIANVSFMPCSWNNQPIILNGPLKNSRLLSYDDLKFSYGIWWSEEDNLLHDFSDELNPAETPFLYTEDQLYPDYSLAIMTPRAVDPQSTDIQYLILYNGKRQEINNKLKEFNPNTAKLEKIWQEHKNRAISPAINSEGEKYKLTNQIMSATMLTNLKYPCKIRGNYYRSFVSGKLWQNPTTADAGFTGLALIEHSKELASDCLNAFLTPPGDIHSAFISFGNPLPIQHHLCHEYWNKTCDREFLQKYYLSLRQYHAFMAGRLGSSSTRSFTSNLLRMYDYMPKTAGHIDLPPVPYLVKNRLLDKTNDIQTTAHCIRSAKILKMIARELGYDNHIHDYDDDIWLLTEGLQNFSWDQQSGYFSYVLHDEEGVPVGLLKDENGCNYNMTVDGISPIISGSCTDEQIDIILDRITDKTRLWSNNGITIVDQSAPYYTSLGYWNGSIWLPYQYFLWKTMFDLGKADLAWNIAETILNLWKNELDRSYNCHEHYLLKCGCGAGWHHFSGFSSVLINIFNAYYTPTRLTTGYEVWLQELNIQPNRIECRLSTEGREGKDLQVMASMPSGKSHTATFNGNKCRTTEIIPGVIAIDLPCRTNGQLIVK